MEITLLNADAMEISPFNICVKCFKVGAVQLHAHFCLFELSYLFFCYICTNLFLPRLSTPVQADPDSVPTHCWNEPTPSQNLHKETRWVVTCWNFNLSVLVLRLVKIRWKKCSSMCFQHRLIGGHFDTRKVSLVQRFSLYALSPRPTFTQWWVLISD